MYWKKDQGNQISDNYSFPNDLLVQCYESNHNFKVTIDTPPVIPCEGTSVGLRVILERPTYNGIQVQLITCSPFQGDVVTISPQTVNIAPGESMGEFTITAKTGAVNGQICASLHGEGQATLPYYLEQSSIPVIV